MYDEINEKRVVLMQMSEVKVYSKHQNTIVCHIVSIDSIQLDAATVVGQDF